MIIKPLVKTLNDYLTEALSPEEIQRLAELGLKTPLKDIFDIGQAIEERMIMDAEVQRLYAEFKARLVALCSEFKEEYEYDEDDMFSAADNIWSAATSDNDSLSVAVADTIFDELT